MDPRTLWKEKKAGMGLRKYTRDFEKRFREKSNDVLEVGKVYALRYSTDPGFPTDKHHVTPVIISLGNFVNENGNVCVRGANLLYLTTETILRILEKAYRVHSLRESNRVAPIVMLHEAILEEIPFVIKDFELHRIKISSEIPVEEWGMIPLLRKDLWGTFNPAALMEDVKRENRKRPEILRKKGNSPLENGEEIIMEEETDLDELKDDLGYIDYEKN